MLKPLRIGMAQINCTVGDLTGSTRKICEYIKKAEESGVDLISFPEMAITGYPPEDLLHKAQFIKDNLKCLKMIAEIKASPTIIVGFVDRQQDKLYNAAAIIHDQTVAGIYRKTHLPNYGVFDEKRYFQEGQEIPVFIINGVAMGVNICEDIWEEAGPAKIQALVGGAEVIVNINASPYHKEKWKEREEMLRKRARDNKAIVAYNNMVGGQDELVFDGHGMIFDQAGRLITQGRQFEEDLIMADLDLEAVAQARLADAEWKKRSAEMEASYGKPVEKIEISSPPVSDKKPPIEKRNITAFHSVKEVYQALILGTKDYVKKNGFKSVVIGLSGGVDSSLTAAIAVDALGKENVSGIFMPSQYSSKESEEDARALAQNLGIEFKVIPIQEIFVIYRQVLSGQFKGYPQDITEENLQARIRGNILMALSNKFGCLVLTTGNKSETSVGYATLYGDMAGGFAVIKDLPKILLYELCLFRNSLGKVIPQRVIEKEPTAELCENQKDRDALPPYPVLDAILQAYVEEDKSPEEIREMGFEEGVVRKVISLVDRNEYKRRQAPPGIKITPKAFGKDRRMPITNRYGFWK
ncbi:MAG: NAD+ synthase [bacterium]